MIGLDLRTASWPAPEALGAVGFDRRAGQGYRRPDPAGIGEDRPRPVPAPAETRPSVERRSSQLPPWGGQRLGPSVQFLAQQIGQEESSDQTSGSRPGGYPAAGARSWREHGTIAFFEFAEAVDLIV